ncbi:MAG: Alanine--tRNA ligase [Candidatus Accumulibacter phosphatis]|uniref:Alanine--tRNA ligase n=1 Tax=Candidatus Accumulibacter phosphatis TaxID=327160 RepID=A0A080LXW2_9PROT|nr:MAG: Alanine--tRNA ligase [Candidatus Accumulibacter phosphatis]
MLGNWSFGDYFKRDSLKWGWELLTQVYKLPPERLLATVYIDDDEAYDIWTREIGLAPERVIRIGDNKGRKYASDNFWMMADTGPCGPCSEIFYDHGPEVAGGPPGSPDADGDRYIEIWNLVFMQFNRDEKGVMHPLPKPSVDTGMGLERLTAVLQHVHSNYEIDLFDALVKAAARETGCADLANPSLRVIADHIRACSFLVCDGVIPGNEGRGYVLRRIARRAMRHGYKLGQKKPFFYRLVADLAKEMGEAYPELVASQDRVTATLKQEEERFGETLENGMAILDAALADGRKELDGDTAFKLYDTYGFPVDLTADIGRERGFTVDMAAFESAMTAQQERSRAASKFKAGQALEYTGAKTAFKGYESLSEEGRVVALYREGTPVDRLSAGETGIVVLDRTPFYAESGGQVGDRGELSKGGTCLSLFAVEDTQKIQATVFGHQGVVRTGLISVGDNVSARVDGLARARTVRNHSATHLMHKALREVLGSHVQQKGSLVDAEKTRFDFAHNAPMTADEIRRVELIVNHEILANAATEARVMPIEEAQRSGAMMLFGEKYGDKVRVLTIGSSKELCGGVHVRRSGDIGLFKIVAETGVAAGIRRVEAVTGDTALVLFQNQDSALSEMAFELGFNSANVEIGRAQVVKLKGKVYELEKDLARLKAKLASAQGDDLLAQAVEVKGARVLAAVMDGADVNALRSTIDKLRDKLQSAAVVLASTNDGKVTLIAGVTADLTGKVKAGELVNMVARQVGGKGGGRPDMAQAGGSDPAGLPAALASVRAWVEQRL